jgi:uncharacterized protein (DUF1800 family)
MTTRSLDPTTAAAIAAHRFGLGEARLATVGDDARGWLLAQQARPAPLRDAGGVLLDSLAALKNLETLRLARRDARAVDPAAMAPPAMSPAAAAAAAGADPLRAVVQADLRARLVTAATSPTPFVERQVLFFGNHFTISNLKGSVRGLVGAYERDAIRPHVGGPFETLLNAAVRHAGMLRYLDNDQSAGPRSRVVARLAQRRERQGAGMGNEEAAPRIGGLNENLAREILELHTLGVSGGGSAYGGWGGYTQADVTEFARLLTGWRVPVRQLMDAPPGTATAQFDPTWHEPGPKTVLGKRYAEGPQALAGLLHDLAVHPNTARFVSFKLARHFVADDPPPALVAEMAGTWLATGGDLPQVMATLVRSPLAWQPVPSKLKTPEEFVISSVRLLGLGERAFERTPDGGVAQLGQRIGAAPSPAGWPDRAEEWLGPDAVWKRVEWATRLAGRVGRQTDARELARASLGPLIGEESTRAVERAADGPQALALLLMSPEFQRR